MRDRYAITIGEDHEAARLEDLDTGEIHEFTGPRALYDALGVLADWRDRDQGKETPPAQPRMWTASATGWRCTLPAGPSMEELHSAGDWHEGADDR